MSKVPINPSPDPSVRLPERMKDQTDPVIIIRLKGNKGDWAPDGYSGPMTRPDVSNRKFVIPDWHGRSDYVTRPNVNKLYFCESDYNRDPSVSDLSSITVAMPQRGKGLSTAAEKKLQLAVLFEEGSRWNVTYVRNGDEITMKDGTREIGSFHLLNDVAGKEPNTRPSGGSSGSRLTLKTKTHELDNFRLTGEVDKFNSQNAAAFEIKELPGGTPVAIQVEKFDAYGPSEFKVNGASFTDYYQGSDGHWRAKIDVPISAGGTTPVEIDLSDGKIAWTGTAPEDKVVSEKGYTLTGRTKSMGGDTDWTVTDPSGKETAKIEWRAGKVSKVEINGTPSKDFRLVRDSGKLSMKLKLDARHITVGLEDLKLSVGDLVDQGKTKSTTVGAYTFTGKVGDADNTANDFNGILKVNGKDMKVTLRALAAGATNRTVETEIDGIKRQYTAEKNSDTGEWELHALDHNGDRLHLNFSQVSHNKVSETPVESHPFTHTAHGTATLTGKRHALDGGATAEYELVTVDGQKIKMNFNPKTGELKATPDGGAERLFKATQDPATKDWSVLLQHGGKEYTLNLSTREVKDITDASATLDVQDAKSGWTFQGKLYAADGKKPAKHQLTKGTQTIDIEFDPTAPADKNVTIDGRKYKAEQNGDKDWVVKNVDVAGTHFDELNLSKVKLNGNVAGIGTTTELDPSGRFELVGTPTAISGTTPIQLHDKLRGETIDITLTPGAAGALPTVTASIVGAAGATLPTTLARNTDGKLILKLNHAGKEFELNLTDIKFEKADDVAGRTLDHKDIFAFEEVPMAAGGGYRLKTKGGKTAVLEVLAVLPPGTPKVRVTSDGRIEEVVLRGVGGKQMADVKLGGKQVTLNFSDMTIEKVTGRRGNAAREWLKREHTLNQNNAKAPIRVLFPSANAVDNLTDDEARRQVQYFKEKRGSGPDLSSMTPDLSKMWGSGKSNWLWTVLSIAAPIAGMWLLSSSFNPLGHGFGPFGQNNFDQMLSNAPGGVLDMSQFTQYGGGNPLDMLRNFNRAPFN